MTHHLRADHVGEAMHECIDNCSDCHDVCLTTVVHCLSMGGEHAAPDHIRMLLDCAQICDTSRDFMLRGSPRHHETCGLCAEICIACAEECEALGGEEMQRCAEACRRCAESCRTMAQAAA